MKAVIPAAGLGTRFLPYTKAQPKEMLPILDKPAIQYVVEEAVDSGIKDILIVTGRGKRAIEDHFDRSVELESHLRRMAKGKELDQMLAIGNMAEIMYVRQRAPLGLGHAISCAEQYVGHEPFAVLLGDDICLDSTPCIKQLMEVHQKKGSSVLAVQDVSPGRVGAYGIVTGRQMGGNIYKVDSIVEKPRPGTLKSTLATIGRYVFNPGIFKHLRSLKPGVGGEIQLTDAVRSMLAEEEVLALRFAGTRYDIGDKATWLRANVEMAASRPDFKDGLEGLLR